MRILVKLFASLRNYGPEQQEMELPENATVGDVIERLGLPERLPLLRIVNGEHRDVVHTLKEGDEVAFFPPIAGGGYQRPVRWLCSAVTERQISPC